MLTVARAFAVRGFDIISAESRVQLQDSWALMTVMFGKPYDTALFEDLPRSHMLRFIPFYLGEDKGVVAFGAVDSQYSGIFGAVGAIENEKKVIRILLDFIRSKDVKATRAVLTLMGCGL
jgi:hypothetical protein